MGFNLAFIGLNKKLRMGKPSVYHSKFDLIYILEL
jgi:hypothetical protein